MTRRAVNPAVTIVVRILGLGLPHQIPGAGACPVSGSARPAQEVFVTEADNPACAR
jgi:hypothetical protein